MNLEIYCAGAYRDAGQPIQMAGCGIVLYATDALGRQQFREYYYGLGSSDPDLTEIQAARLALASVIPAFRVAKTVLYTISQRVADVLTSDENTAKAAMELRRWFKLYRNIEVTVLTGSDERMERACTLARQGLDTQENFDSHTKPVEMGDARPAK